MALALERVLLHQTRLRLPGVALDARGVVLGVRGLVLFASLDRLAAFLGLYTTEHTLGPLLHTLRLDVVRSELGAREVALGFDIDSRERMDVVAEVARVVGGFTFTGSSRHFVQYRDAAAPFGYDPAELSTSELDLVVYHQTFTQAYAVDRTLDLSRFLLSLELRPTALPTIESGERWILADAGLGPSLVSYLSRLDIEAKVGQVQASDAGAKSGALHWLFRVSDVPHRLATMIDGTPGICSFVLDAPGVAIQTGFRHPVRFAACPVFAETGLVLFRGTGGPIVLERVPSLGDVRALSAVSLGEAHPIERAAPRGKPRLAAPLRLVPASATAGPIAATLVTEDDLSLLRVLAYALPPAVLRDVKMALTDRGAVLWSERGVTEVPVGRFYRALHPLVLVPLGTELAPRIDAGELRTALGIPEDHLVLFFGGPSGAALPLSAFVPLERALLTATDWAPLPTRPIEAALDRALPSVRLDPLGWLPIASVRDRP